MHKRTFLFSKLKKMFGKHHILSFKFQQQLKYFNIIFLGLLHLIAIYGIITFPWIKSWKIVLFSFFYGTLAGFGVTAGAHRCFTHRSFKPRFPLKIFLLICYAAAGHNKLFEWVRDHRVHHKYSETDADPHNSNRGFFFAHIGWLMMKKHPDVIKKGVSVDMSDIKNDPILVWYDKNFIYLQLIFCFIIPIGIIRFYFDKSWFYPTLSQIGRYMIVLNSTWLVNSAAHLYGNKPYDKTINPGENFWVSIAAVGEGWHNYHHTFPWDYKASEYGKLNVTTFWLDIFAKLGLAYDLKSPSEELIKRTADKLGDGSYTHYVKENGEVVITKTL
ncbi:acyl-CoA Delta-9 desaturase-like [Onthophagus taurus]|uniref:acyl-CoA Delta-9 desaturase-like n=1 Tax=Onthophagus taurus TaxID=166361 RepID=UPI000C205288|nr:acyl-CoA desaturase-like [Onthophagus taurus]